MLLCDVMQERDAQKDLQKRKQQIEKQVEKEWHEMELVQMDEYDTKIAKKEEEHLKKKHETARVIKQ